MQRSSLSYVWQEISRLNRQFGVTVFLTTHYLEEADHLADRLAIIDQGRIVAEGTPTSLKASIGSGVVTVATKRDRLDDAGRVLGELEGLTELRVDEM